MTDETRSEVVRVLQTASGQCVTVAEAAELLYGPALAEPGPVIRSFALAARLYAEDLQPRSYGATCAAAARMVERKAWP